jgi:endoglucanase
MSLLTALMFGSALAAQDGNGVPAPLLGKLTRGVNLTRWFCYLSNPADTKHYTGYLKSDDLLAFKTLNVHFVRLCLSPEAIYADGKPNLKTLPFVDAAIDRLEKTGIAVIFDLHDNGQLKLDADGHDNSGFVTFWQEITRHYKGKHRESVVFELVNEPVFQKNPEIWQDLQRQTVAAVRAIDPTRTIMVTGTRWGGIDTLVEMKPLAERNLIYSFHCYDPFFFTHQGASWVGDVPQKYKGVPFPSSPESVAAILSGIPENLRQPLVDYGNQRYGKTQLRAAIKKAVDWGHANHVPTMLGEFGAYPLVSPPGSRALWFRAMREIVAELIVPNAIWGYDDALGLGRSVNPDGTIKLDPLVYDSFFAPSPKR